MFAFNFANDPDTDEAEEVQTVAEDEVELKQAQEILVNLQQVHAQELRYRVVVMDLDGFQIKYPDTSDVENEIASTATSTAQAALAQSDLVPNFYEGGMKVWECSLDLVRYMVGHPSVVAPQSRVFEIGCGAGLPGVCAAMHGATVHFQDYNEEVLTTLTAPTLALNVPLDQRSYRFWSGDWASVQTQVADKYGLVLTSETIYSPVAMSRLLSIIASCLAEPHGIALVAAKTYYFGVGGGTRQFEALVSRDGRLKSEVVYRTDDGVRREIIKLSWI